MLNKLKQQKEYEGLDRKGINSLIPSVVKVYKFDLFYFFNLKGEKKW